MRRTFYSLVAVLAALVVPAGPATGQTLSPGCQTVNDPTLDGSRNGARYDGLEFLAGEQITVTATKPSGSHEPTTVFLFIENAGSNETPFPGTVSHLFTADTTATLLWAVDSFKTATWRVGCQSIAPDTTITGNPPNPDTSTSATFTFNGTDIGTGLAGFECQLDGGRFEPCTSPKHYDLLGDGDHTVEVRAIGGAGIVDPSPASFTWTIDTTPPDTTITATPSNPSDSTEATFTFTGEGTGSAVAGFECKLDAGDFFACTTPKTYSGLGGGSHTVQVRATDAAGNVDPTPARFTWTIDIATVSITQAAGQADPTSTRPVNFTARFSSSVTGFTGTDVSFTGSTAPGTLSAEVTGGPSIYNVAVSGMTGGGTVVVSVPANVVDGANQASTSTDNSVTFSVATRPAIVRSSTSRLLKNETTTGGADAGTFSYGAAPLVPFFGDWDGNGTRTPGTFEAGVFKLRNTNSGGDPELSFTFGDPRGFPVAGDFNGDGVDDVAVYRNGLWQIRYSTGETPPTFTMGSGSWPMTVPVAGDWDGDGTDGVGIFVAGTWTLRSLASAAGVDSTVTFAPGTSPYPVVGDWNGDGVDTVGVKAGNGSTWRLTNSTGSAPPVEITFDFGQANTDLPAAWR